MANVRIPSLLRGMAGGLVETGVPGATVQQIIDRLEARYPGVKDGLCQGGRLRPHIAVVIDGVASRRGLRHRLAEASQVHFVPVIGGGNAAPPAGETRGKRLKLGQIALLALAVAISVAVLVLTTQYREDLQKFGSAGLVGLFLISVLSNATLVIPAPGYVFACAAGTVFNFAAVGVVAGLGSAVGELTGYMAGYGGNAVIPRGKLYDRLHAFMLKRGMLAIFLLAAIPNPIFDIGGMLAGMMRLPVWKFLIAAWIGKSVRLGLVSAACLFGIPALQQLLAPR